MRLVGAVIICLLASALAAAEPDLRGFRWRDLGPASMGGRVVDIAVDPTNPSIFFVAAASGGVFKTTNRGITFTPVFEQQPVASIGDLAISSANPDRIWVGTGEANPRNSVSWGNGVYRSDNGGETFVHCGLNETRHIGRIVTHPTDPDIVLIAAAGHTFGPNPERGVYRSNDGGQSFKHVLFIDEHTGCIDMVMDPSNPAVIYAASYERERDATETSVPAKHTGTNAGIWKSTDGGLSWLKLRHGLPNRPLGRIGLSISPLQPTTVYAVIETDRTGQRDAGSGASFPGSRPSEVQGGQSPNLPLSKDSRQYGGVFRSDNGGMTWRLVNSLNPRPFYYSQIRVLPGTVNELALLGVELYHSQDGGKTFQFDLAERCHPDHHALWINPGDPNHWLLGNDGGVYVSYDRGRHWDFLGHLPIAQFYHVTFDYAQPYNLYGGLQDNGTWTGPSQVPSRGAKGGVRNSDWRKLAGGDGFHVAVPPQYPHLLYCESQYGRILRIDLTTGEQVKIHHLGARARFPWNTPLLISAHDPETVYFAGNQVFSVGHDEIFARSLSRNVQFGRSPSSCVTVLCESPVSGALIAGTEDGVVWRTEDRGQSWQELSGPLGTMVPGPYFVSGICTSAHDPDRVLVAFDGHRHGDYQPYLVRTLDGGQQWERIALELPEGSVHCVTQDPENPDLMFAGTEFGCWVSYDGGDRWRSLQLNMPTVAVHDLTIHPREQELIAATHGRGLWILDITLLQQWSDSVARNELHVFEPRPAVLWGDHTERVPLGDRHFIAGNPPPGATFHYWLKDDFAGEVVLSIEDPHGKTMARLDGPSSKGIHFLEWDLRCNRDGILKIGPGTYTVRVALKSSGNAIDLTGRKATEFQVLSDPSHSQTRINAAAARNFHH